METDRFVFLVQHLHVHEDGRECVKLIGVYESRTDAERAIGRVSTQPGFRDFSRVIDPILDDEESGFYIDKYRIGKDHWTEGFVTIV